MNWITLNAPINRLNPYNAGIFTLRLLTAIYMIVGHGFPKLQKILAGDLGFGDPLGIGMEASLYLVTFAEFFCSILLALGLLTRWSLIPLMIAMFVATFVANAGESFTTYEKPLLFLTIYLVLWITGPGIVSFDARIIARKHSPR